MQNSGRQSGDFMTILVAKQKKLVALAMVAIWSPAMFLRADRVKDRADRVKAFQN